MADEAQPNDILADVKEKLASLVDAVAGLDASIITEDEKPAAEPEATPEEPGEGVPTPAEGSSEAPAEEPKEEEKSEESKQAE